MLTWPGADGEMGLIDFGDVVHSWVVNEIAIGCAYATVSSYGKVGPLTWLDLLWPDFASLFNSQLDNLKPPQNNNKN